MITLTITGETMKEVLEKIAGYGFTLMSSIPHAGEPASTPAASIPASAQAPQPYTPVAVAAPLASQAPPPTYCLPAPHPPSVPTTQAPAFTLEQITRAGADLLTARPDLMQALSALPEKYGVLSLNLLKPELFGAVAMELRQLGAKI